MLKLRIITSVILIPIIFALIFFAPNWLFLLALIPVLGLAAWEWAQLSSVATLNGKLIYFAALLLISAGLLLIPSPFILVVALLWWLFAIAAVYLFPRGKIFWQNHLWFRLGCGGLVLVPFFVAIYDIWTRAGGAMLLTYLLVVIWCADIGAYFIGSKYGKTKLAPAVSPKKTLEGVYGGLLLVVIAMAIMSIFVDDRIFFKPLFWLLVILTVCISVVGDLTESVTKRFADVKDSGSFLPGHGGVLDRIDSLTAAAPIFALGLWLLH